MRNTTTTSAVIPATAQSFKDSLTAQAGATARARSVTEVVVQQSDGLGNQLFQYAAGRSLSKRYGGMLRIACQPAHNLTTHGYRRPVMLQKFAIKASIGPATQLDRLVFSTRPHFALPSRVVRKVGRIQVIREADDPLFLQHSFSIKAAARRVYLHGYWQAHSIVDSVGNELRQEFSLREPPSELSRRQADRILSCRSAISVHIRRGDYLVLVKHKALPTEYYEQSLSLMGERFPDSTFFVFSDDAPSAREWLANRPQFVVVDHNDDTTAHEDLWLMSLCRHHIIANSTFSWWGAWLNARNDKCVIAPSNWHGVHTAESDIAAPGWQLI